MTDPSRRPLRIATRRSPMALAQADHVAGLLRALDPGLRTGTVPVATEGDAWQGDLARLGGKGLFVKAVDRRVLREEADVSVHCLKDVPGDQPPPEGLVLAATLPRADVRDVLVVPGNSPVTSLADLPVGAALATASVRRAAQLLALRPDLRIVPVRGAVGTRLAKLDSAAPPAGARAAAATVLARAGLERLGLTGRVRQEFSADEIVPAVGAGVLVLACREDDATVTGLLARLDHAETHRAARAERAMLNGLRGHCNSPIAGHCATGPDGRLSLTGLVFSRDGTRRAYARLRATADEGPASLGARVCAALLDQGARALIDEDAH